MDAEGTEMRQNVELRYRGTYTKFSLAGQSKAKKVSSHAEKLVRTPSNLTALQKNGRILGY